MEASSSENGAIDASDAVLPPELFPLISDALISLNARKTLLELMCSNRQHHILCLPSLMRFIDLSETGGFNSAKRDAFAMDSLGTNKFAYTKHLKIDHGLFSDEEMPALVAIQNGMVNLESLDLRDWDHGLWLDLSKSLWKHLISTPTLPLRAMKFSTPDLDFVGSEDVEDVGCQLPATITDVSICLNRGQEAQQRVLFRTLADLPHLNRLELMFLFDWHEELPNFDPYREIFTFPKLLNCLRKLDIAWPRHADLLIENLDIEELLIVFLG